MKSKGRIFLIEDDEIILSMLSRTLKKEGYEVYSEAKTDDILNKIRSWSPDVLMLDIRLPGQSGLDILQELRDKDIETEVVMMTADVTAESAVRAMKLGAADYLTKPFNMDEVKIVISKIIEKENLKREVEYLRKVSSPILARELIGESKAIKKLKTKAEKIAKANVSSILITGESGTGKEVLARYIHHSMHGDSDDVYNPFIAVSCTALPEHLLESELFGYEKGAFTDAKSPKKGLFEMSKNGTILLDEIGDMKHSLQSKLLRVLEERRVRRIGGNEEIPIDVTVIATTNRNLADAVKSGEFRRDLFYRLSTFYLWLPPLRDRAEDVLVLARHFISTYATKYNNKTIKGFSPEAEKYLLNFSWPGNVRELKNLIERIVALENTDVILPEYLPNWILDQPVKKSSSSINSFILPEKGISLEELEKDLLKQALEKAKNNKTHAAKLLSMSYDSFRYQLKRYGLE
ncbi:MAG: sigma-54 dependent transcriptional regulator [Nitrospirota bacterium]